MNSRSHFFTCSLPTLNAKREIFKKKTIPKPLTEMETLGTIFSPSVGVLLYEYSNDGSAEMTLENYDDAKFYWISRFDHGQMSTMRYKKHSFSIALSSIGGFEAIIHVIMIGALSFYLFESFWVSEARHIILNRRPDLGDNIPDK